MFTNGSWARFKWRIQSLSTVNISTILVFKPHLLSSIMQSELLNTTSDETYKTSEYITSHFLQDREHVLMLPPPRQDIKILLPREIKLLRVEESDLVVFERLLRPWGTWGWASRRFTHTTYIAMDDLKHTTTCWLVAGWAWLGRMCDRLLIYRFWKEHKTLARAFYDLV